MFIFISVFVKIMDINMKNVFFSLHVSGDKILHI